MTTSGLKRPREDTPATNGLTVLHRSRKVPWSVAAVTCIAACPDGSVFAAGYDDGKVEVFDAVLFNLIGCIAGADGSEVSSVAWVRAPGDSHWRLFVSMLDGFISEICCQQLQAIASTDSGGGAIWCLRAAPTTSSGSSGDGSSAVVTQLAAACGDGSVKLFSVTAGVPGAEFVKSLPRVEGNVLALAWHPSGQVLVSGGSDGCLHSWDLQLGTELQRITVGTSSSSPACVWALAVLPDGTIVSGDQEGAVQFWDGRFGTLLSRQQQFAADVLALAAAPDGSSVWASGVDHRVAMFQLVPDKASGLPRWVYLDRRDPHSHDVRCLAVLQRPDSHPLLLSGGNDGQLVLYNLLRFLKEHPTRQSKAPQCPLLQLSSRAGSGQPAVMMHVQGRQIKLWQLGQAVQQQPLAHHGADGCYEGDPWDLSTPPQLLISITTNSRHHIMAAALAPDARTVAAADKQRLRIFRLTEAEEQEDAGEVGDTAAAGRQQLVQRVKLATDLDSPVVCCTFSSDSKLLFAVTGSGKVIAVDAISGAVTACTELALSADGSSNSGGQRVKGHSPQQQQQQESAVQASWCGGLSRYMPRASCIAASANGQVLAVASAAGVELLSAPQLQRRGRLTLVGEPAPITALSFSPNSKFMALTTAANGLTAYSTATGMPTQWTLKHHAELAELLQQLPGSIRGLSFKPSQASPLSLLVHSAGGLCHVDMGSALAVHKPADKVPRSKSNPAAGPQPSPCSEVGRNGRLLLLQHSCLLLAYLSPDEALLLEKPWQEVLQHLVPPLHRHRYGCIMDRQPQNNNQQEQQQQPAASSKAAGDAQQGTADPSLKAAVEQDAAQPDDRSTTKTSDPPHKE